MEVNISRNGNKGVPNYIMSSYAFVAINAM
jgi:hypothetical protein